MGNNICIREEADKAQIARCKERLASHSDRINHLSSGLELAGNKVRLKILLLLHTETRLCVCDLSDVLEMSISAVSQHLRKLKDRNLVQAKKEGQIIYHSLTGEYERLLNPLFDILLEPEALELI